jgi:hypothetical protein
MLRQRYEQIRARALERAAIGISETVMRLGMRAWMEAGCQAEIVYAAPAPTEGRLPLDGSFRQIVAVWASAIVDQAERSYGGSRQA